MCPPKPDVWIDRNRSSERNKIFLQTFLVPPLWSLAGLVGGVGVGSLNREHLCGSFENIFYKMFNMSKKFNKIRLCLAVSTRGQENRCTAGSWLLVFDS